MNEPAKKIVLTRHGQVTMSIPGFKAWVGGNHVAYEIVFQPSTRSGNIGTLSIRESNSETWLQEATDVSRETFEELGESVGWHKVGFNTYARKPHYTRRRREHTRLNEEMIPINPIS